MIKTLTLALIGIVGGITSGLFGVGGGVIFVPLLMLLMKWNIHLAIGTSLLAIIPTALLGGVRYASRGRAEIGAALVLAGFAMAGAWLGTEMSFRLDAVLLRKLFAGFLLVMAARLFFQS